MGQKQGDLSVAVFAIILVAAGLLGLAAFYGLPGGADRTEAPVTGEEPEVDRIVSATTATFDQHVLNSSVPVVVDFYADWCGPCRTQSRILEDIASQLTRVKIVKVDVDANPEIANKYQIEALPTLLVFHDGRITKRTVGVTSKSELTSALSE